MPPSNLAASSSSCNPPPTPSTSRKRALPEPSAAPAAPPLAAEEGEDNEQAAAEGPDPSVRKSARSRQPSTRYLTDHEPPEEPQRVLPLTRNPKRPKQ